MISFKETLEQMHSQVYAYDPELEKKLNHLCACFEQKAFEDAAGHLCDLLEHCRQNIITDHGLQYVNLEWFIRKYGASPIPMEQWK